MLYRMMGSEAGGSLMMYGSHVGMGSGRSEWGQVTIKGKSF
jgi:hypothetical protein